MQAQACLTVSSQYLNTFCTFTSYNKVKVKQIDRLFGSGRKKQNVKLFITWLNECNTWGTTSSPIWHCRLGSPNRLQERLQCQMTQHGGSCLSKVWVCVWGGVIRVKRMCPQKQKGKTINQ